ncbi:LPS export ABC transporter periplasmic protein LptC [Flavobacterium sp. NST-5]|uniref:LPS export ABC transporter periplasmic protein LptC n=1 Tax=Flavobacterium ichthyis TaxID=2698827 RepID=A0ABW9Z6V1_9FLAO|nr:LPS export ABC transporter periplasmic protein LptC [Flavobacterium ichthyis]NBL64592.1 LPS export ABC transporter periplasmic protein LptC [Flavobacterium ichthyis]
MKYISYILIGIFVLIFTSCQNNIKEVQKINRAAFAPMGEADSVNLKYTDSGRITAILKSPKMLDFGNVAFPYQEFPKGVDVTIYDAAQKRTFVRSDYAISFKGTNIIDLQGNVKVTSEDGKMLETTQLYYDQKREWFFTEKKCKLTLGEGNIFYTKGFDASRDLKDISGQTFFGEGQADDF